MQNQYGRHTKSPRRAQGQGGLFDPEGNRMAKFHITTKNGRQRALWLRLFGTDVLSVTAAYLHERFYPDGRSSWYGFDTRAIGEHAYRRPAAYIAARHWGKTFEAALADVRYGMAGVSMRPTVSCSASQKQPKIHAWQCQKCLADPSGQISGPGPIRSSFTAVHLSVTNHPRKSTAAAKTHTGGAANFNATPSKQGHAATIMNNDTAQNRAAPRLFSNEWP